MCNSDHQQTHIRSYPLWDGIHDKGLDLETFLTNRVPRPQRSGSWPSAPRGDQANNDLGRLPTAGTTPWETWRRRQRTQWMLGCTEQLTNHHHSYSAATASTVAPMLAPAATWLQDHDENHAPMNTRRWRNLQAKLVRTSLGLSTPQSGEPPLCNKPWPRTLYKGSKGSHLDTFSFFIL
jgi:hypothetical protein